MTFEHTQLIAIISIMMVSAFIQGATGFGFGLFVMALLPLFLPFQEVSMALPMILVPMILINFWARARHFRWQPVKCIVYGTLLGVAPGVYLLAQLDDLLLKRILGVVLIVAAAHAILLRSAKRSEETRCGVGLSIGLCSGLLGGAFNTGGPPAIYYLYRKAWPVQQIIASLQFVFLSIAMAKVTLGAVSSVLTPLAFKIALAGALPVLVGLIAGIRLSRHLSGLLARRIAFSLLGVLGIYLLLFA